LVLLNSRYAKAIEEACGESPDNLQILLDWRFCISLFKCDWFDSSSDLAVRVVDEVIESFGKSLWLLCRNCVIEAALSIFFFFAFQRADHIIPPKSPTQNHHMQNLKHEISAWDCLP